MDIRFEPATVRVVIDVTPDEAAQIVKDMQAPPEVLASEYSVKLFNIFQHVAKMSSEAVLKEMERERQRMEEAPTVYSGPKSGNEYKPPYNL
jgi:hypothetical protein